MPEVHGILDRLLLFLTYEGKPHVTAEALITMTDVLRRCGRRGGGSSSSRHGERMHTRCGRSCCLAPT